MPASPVFAVNDYGRVFTLQTNEVIWKELAYLGVDFKRVSVHDSVVWALGGDHQIYVYVYGTSVPIRVNEEVYENQRWNPLNGFTGKLLPTDRSSFSSADGLTSRKLTEVRLPTLAWQWEDAWHLQDTFEGKALDKEAWTYAIDFPQTYTIDKKWNSCVRRRKWIRYRRYMALDTWSNVPALHQDSTEDPFIDICVGGGNIPGQDSTYLVVWGVTVSNKVVVREGVSSSSPEGVSWKYIDTPFDQEIMSLSIGRSGRVWAVTWKGELLVRSGISRNCPYGSQWLRVDSPNSLGVLNVSVGESSVWVICRDHSVWFRQNLDDYYNPHLGTSWLDMVGSLTMLSIGPNDQVWGIEYETNNIVFRAGITKSLLSGQCWKEIYLPLLKFDPNRDDVSISESEKDSSSEEAGEAGKPPSEELSVSQPISPEFDEPEQVVPDLSSTSSVKDSFVSMCSSTASDTVIDYFGKEYVEEVSKNTFEPIWDKAIPQDEDKSSGNSTRSPSLTRKRNASSSTLNSDIVFSKGSLSEIRQEESVIVPQVPQDENSWIWISGGGCWIEPNILPKWFFSDISLGPVEQWKQSMHLKLIDRDKREKLPYTDYHEPFEHTSWVIEGQCRLFITEQWAPATLSLEMVSAKRFACEQSLDITYILPKHKKIKLPCGRMVLFQVNADVPSKCLLSIYSLCLPVSPVVLSFPSEDYAQSWLDHLSSACGNSRGYSSLPDSSRGLWAVTTSGNIYVHEMDRSEAEIHSEMISSQYNLDIGLGKVPFSHSLIRSFRPGCFIVVSVELKPNARRFLINLCSVESEKTQKILHVNPRLQDKVVVFNSKLQEKWGTEETEPLIFDDNQSPWEISMLCDENDIKICINDKISHRFAHRVEPSTINQIEIMGDIEIKNVEYNCGACDRCPSEYFWRNIKGHLKGVESGAQGIIWGLSYDSHVYVYTGAITKDENNADAKKAMSDIRHFYIWENQRWNPISGFTSKLLATDRKPWSDVAGKTVLSQNNYRLPSRHWQWLGDWTVDYQTPGGVDKNGWQYATDFPMNYHPYLYVTDLVRRRRYLRKARINSAGPWKQMEKVTLISLSISNEVGIDNTVPVWGITLSNEVVFREGVSRNRPEGSRWALVPSESPMVSICTTETATWAVSCDGRAHLRIGVSKDMPKGVSWTNIDAPDVALKQVSAGGGHVWAVDQEGNLYHREGVLPLFPEGTSWTKVCGDVSNISVDIEGVPWAILTQYTHEKKSLSGVLAQRSNVSSSCPLGSGWSLCAGSGWSYVCGRMRQS